MLFAPVTCAYMGELTWAFHGNASILFLSAVLNSNLILQAECYHYLFDAAIKLHQLGLDWSTPSHGPIHSVNGALGNVRSANTPVKARKLASDNGIEPLRVSLSTIYIS